MPLKISWKLPLLPKYNFNDLLMNGVQINGFKLVWLEVLVPDKRHCVKLNLYGSNSSTITVRVGVMWILDSALCDSNNLIQFDGDRTRSVACFETSDFSHIHSSIIMISLTWIMSIVHILFFCKFGRINLVTRQKMSPLSHDLFLVKCSNVKISTSHQCIFSCI